MRDDRAASRIEQQILDVTRTSAERVVHAAGQWRARVEERSIESRKHSRIVAAVGLDASLERPVELRERGWSGESLEPRTQRKWERAATGLELAERRVEQ
jgi:hypothetical protein